MSSPQIDIPQEAVGAFCRKWQVIELGLFGSVLREDFGPDSDIDVLVTFADDAGWSLFDIAAMIEELRGIFGRNVDLVEKEAVRNPFRRHNMLRSEKIIYASG